MKNLDKLTFATLPYGTGNDIGRQTGWGIKVHYWGKNVETMIQEVLKAEKDRISIWEVEFDATLFRL